VTPHEPAGPSIWKTSHFPSCKSSPKSCILYALRLPELERAAAPAKRQECFLDHVVEGAGNGFRHVSVGSLCEGRSNERHRAGTKTLPDARSRCGSRVDRLPGSPLIFAPPKIQIRIENLNRIGPMRAGVAKMSC